METNTLLFTAVLTLLPISELRGGIPYALARGVNPLIAYGLCIVLNALVGPLMFTFLSTIHKLLDKSQLYHALFSRLVERSRKKVQTKIARYGYIGVAFFVAVPLPITGAYTGALGAWVLGMEARKACYAIALGVCVAGVLVSLVSYFGIQALSLFLR